MPSKNVVGNLVNNGLGYQYRAETLNSTWTHSPRDAAGKLQLRANAMSMQSVKRRVTGTLVGKYIDQQAMFGVADPTGTSADKDGFLLAGCVNRSYGKLVSEIRSDSASLGMTLASWRKSWVMIAEKALIVANMAKGARRAHERDVARHLRRIKNRKKKLRWLKKPRGLRDPKPPPGVGWLPKSSADRFLEMKFGWEPLLADIHAAAKVFFDDIPAGWVRGSATDDYAWSGSPPGYASYTSLKASYVSKCRVKQTCRVVIDNPNVWLLNRLGLINPAVVVWDRIPWSFVVGWFGNFNQVLGSLTDFVGLSVSEGSTTVRWERVSSWTVDSWQSGKPPDTAFREAGQARYVKKTRTLGLALPTLKARTPTVDMGLALINVSLMIQQVSRLTK